MAYESGIITTVAGTGERGFSGDGGPAASAGLSEPFMCAFDSAGNLYIAEATNHCIRRVDRDSGVIVTIGRYGRIGVFGRRRPRHGSYLQPALLLAGGRQRGRLRG